MFTKKYLLPAALSALVTASAAQAEAPDSRFDKGQDRSSAYEQMQSGHVYGQEVMTNWEIRQHHLILRSLSTEQARKAYLDQHRQRVQERAMSMGVELAGENEYYEDLQPEPVNLETPVRHTGTNHLRP